MGSRYYVILVEPKKYNNLLVCIFVHNFIIQPGLKIFLCSADDRDLSLFRFKIMLDNIMYCYLVHSTYLFCAVCRVLPLKKYNQKSVSRVNVQESDGKASSLNTVERLKVCRALRDHIHRIKIMVSDI